MSRSTKPVFVFAHGAGASSQSEWMQGWTRRLSTLGHVRPFDYPYMRAGRKAPDRLPKLIDAHRQELAAARAEFPKSKGIFLIGKSMGSRVGCHLSLEEDVAGVICLGFPLQALGTSKAVRREVLESMTTPVLFVQGDRDRMSPLELFAEVREVMIAPSRLHVVEAGDHSLVVTKRRLRDREESQEDVDRETLGEIGAFVEAQL